MRKHPPVDTLLPLSAPMFHILIALGDEAMHGYAVMQSIAERSGGQVRLLPGTLYSTIKKMLALQLLEECDAPAEVDSDDERRRYYRVTRFGREVRGAETERLSMLVRIARGANARA
ncbi:MAG TPA: helix-turn-helix transcriptional regulator [Vicinamibacterales bacterium]|nr:helix-turn-helix transcriptional regulator [Vicinamibacterales bacterium]